jgi:cytochrome c oxidase subunit 3
MTDPSTSTPEKSSPQNPPLHIAGAGTLVVAILLGSLSILFLSSIAAYLIIRSQTIARMGDHPQWPPAGLPNIPSSLWLSTLVIIISSVTIQLALNAIRRDDEKKLLLYLNLTSALGLLFLILQAFNWYEFYNAIPHEFRIEGAWLGMFYTLTGLHAAHVIGGLIPLGITTWNARKNRYSRNYHPGVRYTTLYWHFLDIIWVALFITLKL